MSSEVFGLLDLILGFGVVVAICVWQLAATEKAKKARIEREKAKEGALLQARNGEATRH